MWYVPVIVGAAIGGYFLSTRKKKLPAPQIGAKIPLKPGAPPQAIATPKVTAVVAPPVNSGLAPVAITQQSGIVTTANDPLNIRNAPNSSGAIVGHAAKGSTVTISGSAIPGSGSTKGWFPVTQGGVSGFGSADFITPATAGGTAPSAPQTVKDADAALQQTLTNTISQGETLPGQQATINTSSSTLNVRGGPGTSFPIIGTCAKDEIVTVTGANKPGPGSASGWLPILTRKALKGWVSADFVRFLQNTAPQDAEAVANDQKKQDAGALFFANGGDPTSL